MMFTKETSPFGSSPFDKSPRLFWKEQTTSPAGRFGSENEYERDPSPSLSPKRSSIENLKKASRVKNSSMFAREQKNEYDPASVQPLDRPLAAGRPLSTQVQGNAFGGNGLAGLRKQNEEFRSHRRGESLTKIPMLSPSKTSPANLPTQSSFSSSAKENTPPAEGRTSPSKSSLASPFRSRYAEYNPDSSVFSDDDDLGHMTPRPPLRRHAKSVTFDAAPPIINEYEMVTPDPSSVASGSREGSYDSQEDMSFDQEDSFDASLEDTEKTPVVLPEDWRHMSPDIADTSLTDTYDDVFDGRDSSPMASARPNGVTRDGRNGSIASDGESRPLPPLPGMQSPEDRRRRDSSTGLAAAAERASAARRSLPLPPQAAGFSKADLLNMRESSMTLEDRLRLMNFDDDRNTETPTQEHHNSPEQHEQDEESQVAETEDTTDSDTTVDGPKAPRISRESILRKVKSRNFDEYDNYNYDAETSPDRSYGDLADLDPDVPIPSREASSNFDEVPSQMQEEDGDSVLDAYSAAETTEVYLEPSLMEEHERESSVIRHEIKEEPEYDDDASQYSSQPEEQPTSQSTIETSGPPTPTALNSSPSAAEKEARRDELFASFKEHDMDLRLDPLRSSFETAPSPLDSAPKIDAMREFLRRPETPESHGEAEVEEPTTPDSVIHHSMEEDASMEEDVPAIVEPTERSSPVVPEEFATIKGAGGKLKTRPSLIPEDVDMAATRRQVSGTHPPPVPERSPKRQSLCLEVGHVADWDSQPELPTSNKENLMLDLDIGGDSNDLSFGLDKEFDHIIEAQKVDNLFPLPSYAQFPSSTAGPSHGLSLMSGEGFVYNYSPANGYVREQKGYLMRQNTKVVVASSRQFSDEKPTDAEKAAKAAKDNSRKTSAERKPAWTTEPWNSKARRRSLRTASGSRRAPAPGPVPPLPGQESAVAGGLDSVEEQNGEEIEDGTERGRLFVKVVGVKDLDLPLPKSMSNPYFSMHVYLHFRSGTHSLPTHP
jgi:hypothetical protein